MVGILVSFWDGLFSGAMLILGSVLGYVYPVMLLLSGSNHDLQRKHGSLVPSMSDTDKQI